MTHFCNGTTVAAVVVGLAWAANGRTERPMLQQLEIGTEAVPLRVAPAVYAHGSLARRSSLAR